jgi:hypothetical protein
LASGISLLTFRIAPVEPRQSYGFDYNELVSESPNTLLPVTPCRERERGRGGVVGRASPSTLPSPPLSLSLSRRQRRGGGWSPPPDPAPQPTLASASPPWLRDDNGAASRGTTTGRRGHPSPRAGSRYARPKHFTGRAGFGPG